MLGREHVRMLIQVFRKAHAAVSKFRAVVKNVPLVITGLSSSCSIQAARAVVPLLGTGAPIQ